MAEHQEEDNHHHHTSSLFFFFLLVFHFPFVSGDDSPVMTKLSRCFAAPPPGWSGANQCKWQGVSCSSSGDVVSIKLIGKSLSGEIPPDLLNGLSSLRSLALQQNRISGHLPSLSDLNNLQSVYLDSNRFEKIPPRFLSNLPNLQTLSLANNPISPWTIPAETLSELTALQSFSALNASISSEIPDIFGSLPSLQTLKLSYNNLTGRLPPSLSKSAIETLLINDQKIGLSGTLQVFDEMSSLTQLWVHNNDFTGPIPDLARSKNLFDLQLRGNRLTGLVPDSVTNHPKLANVSLQNNMLQGPVPVFRPGIQATTGSNSFCDATPGRPCDRQVTVLLEVAGAFGYPSSLAESWKGNDACDGWSHVSCDTRGKSVIGINLAKQGLLGKISPIFANLTSLRSLILSDNNLFGRIPDSLTRLKELRRLDLSRNNLTGHVPDFSKTVTVSVDGNRFIGTNVDTTPPSMLDHGSEEKGGLESTSKSSSLKAWVVAAIVIGSVVILAFVISLVCVKRQIMMYLVREWLRKRRGKIEKNIGSTTKNNVHPVDGSNVIYSIEALHRATNKFSDENILGKGGFGVVYKGQLDDGTRVAVKRMELGSLGTKGSSEFDAEIAVLSKVRHRHLVALLGYCVNRNEKLLVYEHMPEGTLGRHLLQWKAMGRSPLTWKQRLVIALDVARGIEYLHSLAQQSFIHRDLKPSNILLGSDMRAKVSDFGLVKLAPDGKYSMETRLAGTFGYLAPEYATTGRVTTKVDVFAFGVVLMEMITARKALDESLPEEEVQLVAWFRPLLSDRDYMRKSIDPCLAPDEEMFESICKAAELAGHCTARDPSQRPEMGHAVNVLSPLVEEWKPSKSDDYEDSVTIDLSGTLSGALRKWRSGEGSDAPTNLDLSNTFGRDIEGR